MLKSSGWMTFLPILERELRVRARRRTQFWGRVAIAAVAVSVCLPPLVWSGPWTAPAMIGREAFSALITAAFVLCCAACFLTADTISGERREGTLGLLFLTRVKYLDVLLGKFASSGLNCLLGLTAFLPVLALPLLTGGVSGGEAARKAAVLLNTLFLALCIGICASARGFDRYRTMRAACAVLVGLVLGPGLFAWLLPGLWLASPLGALAQAADLNYRATPGRYWLSLLLVHAIGWLLLAVATVLVRQTGAEQMTAGNYAGEPQSIQPQDTKEAGVSSVAPERAAEESLTKCRYCGKQNEPEAVYCLDCGTELHPRELPKRPPLTLSSAPTPLHWLLRRQRGLQPLVWIAAVIAAFRYMAFSAWGRFFGTMVIGISWAISLVTTAITGALIAWVASHYFFKARQSRELELLLTTPLGAGQLVSTQWDFLKRLLRFPVLLMIAPSLLQGWILFGVGSPAPWRVYYVFSLLAGAANTVLAIGAVCWMAMWSGLRVIGQARAVFWAVTLTYGAPYAFNLVWSMVFRGFAMTLTPGGSWWSPRLFILLLPSLVTLFYYLWLMRLARGQLLHELTAGEPLEPQKAISQAFCHLAGALRRARQWRSV